MMPDLPTAAQAYRILLQEETHLQQSTSGGSVNDSMACRVEKRKYQDKGGSKNYSSEGYTSKKSVLWCEHRKISGHIKEKCWKIIGYPSNHPASHNSNSWRRDSNKSSVNSISTHEETDGMVSARSTQEQYQQILDMLNKQESKTSNTYANTSQLTGTFCSASHKTNIRIEDSGATDHMCNDLCRFDNRSLIEKENHEVTIPNGTK